MEIKKLTHEEILNIRKTPSEALTSNRHPISLILHNVRSAYNVGSIFRTSDSALLEKIYLCGYTPTPEKKEVAKTALGAVNSVPWQYCENTLDAINYCKSLNCQIIALELTDSSKLYYEYSTYNFPLALVIGNELVGIDDHILAHCHHAISIPMYGVKHSLNVSVATGIASYEIIKCYISNYNNT